MITNLRKPSSFFESEHDVWINEPAKDFVAITLDEFRANWKYNLGDEKFRRFFLFRDLLKFIMDYTPHLVLTEVYFTQLIIAIFPKPPGKNLVRTPSRNGKLTESNPYPERTAQLIAPAAAPKAQTHHCYKFESNRRSHGRECRL